MTDKAVTITVDQDGLTGQLQLSITDGETGFRLAGPKYIGSSENLLTAALDQRDADEIRTYLDKITDDDAEYAAYLEAASALERGEDHL